VWTSDITYLRTGQGWLYVCAVRDGCSRRGIGWAVDEHMHTDLIQAAPTMAVAMRGELAQQVILHADRGLSVHLAAAGRVRARAQPGPLSRPQSGVLGQRCGRIILDHRENRILRQQPKQPPSSRSATGSNESTTDAGATRPSV